MNSRLHLTLASQTAISFLMSAWDFSLLMEHPANLISYPKPSWSDGKHSGIPKLLLVIIALPLQSRVRQDMLIVRDHHLLLNQSDESRHCLPLVPISHGADFVHICQGLISSMQYPFPSLVSSCPSFSMSSFPVRCCQRTNWSIIVLTLINASSAFRAFSNSSFVFTNLTIPCVGALSSDIACSPAVAALSLGEYYPEDTLIRTCTANCAQALASYENKVIAACGKQTWKGYEDTDMPLAIIPDMLRYHYNVTCLMDSGRYCNAVAAKAAAALDSEGIEKSLKVLKSR